MWYHTVSNSANSGKGETMSVVNTTANPRKQASLVAGIGALVGIVAFLLLPYLIFTVTVTDTQFSTPQSHSASISVGTGLISILAGLIWVEALLAIAILVIAALLLSKDAPFGVSTAPVETQVRRAGYAVIALGIAGIAYHFLFISTIGAGQMLSLFQSLTTDTNSLANQLNQSHTSASPSMANALGSWIYLLGMCAAIVGGVLLLRAVSPQEVVQPQSWPQYAQYSQPAHPQQPQPSQPLPQQGWQPAQPQQPQAWPQSAQPQQQGWQPTQQAQPPQGWQQPPQPEQRWPQPPSFPSS